MNKQGMPRAMAGRWKYFLLLKKAQPEKALKQLLLRSKVD
jgi:hypothetical protein